MSKRLPFVLSVIVALLVVVTVHAVDFPGSVPNFVRASGGGTLLDVRPSFSEEATYDRLSAYGEQGRRNYAFRNRTVDVLLPLAVFPALLLAMMRAVEPFSIGRVARAMLYALPFAYLAFDLAENGAVLTMLSRYPVRMHFLAGALPYLTVIKRAASLLSLALPLLFFIVMLTRRRFAAR
jgi:hypothetical protein